MEQVPVVTEVGNQTSTDRVGRVQYNQGKQKKSSESFPTLQETRLTHTTASEDRGSDGKARHEILEPSTSTSKSDNTSTETKDMTGDSGPGHPPLGSCVFIRPPQ